MAVFLVVTLLVVPVLVVATRRAMAATRWDARFRCATATFPCKVRPTGGLRGAVRERWPLRRARAAWVHDVLILTRGVLFPRVTALPVRMPEETLRDADRREVRRLGAHVLVIVLRLDDGSLVEVAAGRSHRSELVGPFLAAAIPGLPPGPQEQPNLGR